MSANQRINTNWRIQSVEPDSKTVVETRRLSDGVRIQLVNDRDEITAHITVRGDRVDTDRMVKSPPDPFVSQNRLHEWAERQAREYLKELNALTAEALNELGD